MNINAVYYRTELDCVGARQTDPSVSAEEWNAFSGKKIEIHSSERGNFMGHHGVMVDKTLSKILSTSVNVIMGPINKSIMTFRSRVRHSNIY